MPKKTEFWGLLCATALTLPTVAHAADAFTDALTGGKVSGNFRLRYEEVDVDTKTIKDASALTLRSRLGYETAPFYGFTGLLEFEDIHVINGMDHYSPETTDSSKPTTNPYTYAAIVDPERTEVNRAYIRYRGVSKLDTGLGRQRILLDNQRYVGPSAWRQDEQTFDALTAKYDGLADWSFYYAYVNRVNGIASVKPLYNYDMDTSDNLFNISYSGFQIGKLTAYGYFLNNQEPYAEVRNIAPDVNALNPSLRYLSNDTYGLRFDGTYIMPTTMPLRLFYTAEYAKQKQETVQAAGTKTKFEMNYSLFEAGAGYTAKTGLIAAKIAQETLGSDKDKVGTTTVMQGFQTPYATKHIFNGWADMFLNTPAGGLKDRYATLSADFPYSIKVMAMYHKFYEVDGPVTGGGARKFGNELDLQALKQFGPNYTLGIKYGKYIADKEVSTIIGTTLNTGTNKFWVWGEFVF